MNKRKIKLGKDMRTKSDVFTSCENPNLSILLTGLSGSGKTRAMWAIMDEVCANGDCVLAFNLGNTSEGITCSHVEWFSVHEHGIPFDLFTPLKYEGKEEDLEDVTDFIADAFSMTSRMGKVQKILLKRAIRTVAFDKSGCKKDLIEVGKILRSHDDVSAEIVYDHFRQIFHRGMIALKEDLIEPGKVTVIDLNGFSTQTQSLLMQMIISFVWRFQLAVGTKSEKTLFIACDEFQHLGIHKDSVLAEILREGRRHNTALLLATQTIGTFKSGERAVVQQAATQLYFKPSPSEVNKVLSYLTCEKSMTIKEKLETLKIGHCIAKGSFQIGTATTDRPLHLSFYR